MNRYSGDLCIYFPCHLKGRRPLKWFHEKWNRCRDRQVRDIHMRRAPLTDLMDSKVYRSETEDALCSIQGKIDVWGYSIPYNAPYALHCIQQAYRKNREDNCFSKNTSVVISRFTLFYYKNHTTDPDVLIQAEGTLIYNVNADNNVATYIVMLHFDRMSVDDIILLKHIFYKRLKVSIQEYEISHCSCPCNAEYNDVFKCITGKKNVKIAPYISFQDYIAQKDRFQRYAKRTDVDYRARYSFVELDNQFFSKSLYKDFYGIMCADEGYAYLSCKRQNEVFRHNLSIRESYGYYQCELNGLMVKKNYENRAGSKNNQRFFEMQYNEDDSHIKTDDICNHCVAGIQEEFFPAFLKAVELHFLINNVQTSETEENDKSYINPYVFLKRGYKLWNILYQLDVNRYHLHERMHDAFAIKDKIAEIREEYKTILQHTMNFAVIIFAIIQVIIGFVTFIKS